MEYDKLPQLMAEYLPDPLDQNSDFIEFMRNTPNLFDQFADQFIIQLEAPRQSAYL